MGLVKVAVPLGRIAVGPWESWDRLEFPPLTVLKRLDVDSLAEILQAIRHDLEAVVGHCWRAPMPRPAGSHVANPGGTDLRVSRSIA